MEFEQRIARVLEDLLLEHERRDREDAARFAELEEDRCQLCEAEGPDMRNLFIKCMYAVNEAVPEAISLTKVSPEALQKGGYYLRICKSCRGRLLAHLGQWRAECLEMRDEEKDSDGTPDPYEPERNIPVRVYGAIQMMTRAEYEAWRKAADH